MMKNNSTKQVIFCTETDNSQIDDSYVKKLLEVYFDFGTSLKRSFVHMKGKTKYNDKSVIAQIDKKKTDYSKNNKEGKNFVVYVVDARFITLILRWTAGRLSIKRLSVAKRRIRRKALNKKFMRRNTRFFPMSFGAFLSAKHN